MSLGKIVSENKFADRFLTIIEQAVFNLIKELLKSHKTFQLDDSLIDFYRKKLECSEIEIYLAIFSLVQQKFLVPETILTRDQILENVSRAKIYALIQQQPGVHLQELCNKLNISNSVIRIHLKVLEKFNYVRTKKYTKLVLFFLQEFPDTYDDFFFVMKNETERRIIQNLLNQCLTLTELSSLLNLHHSTIQYHLQKLTNLQIITSTPINSQTKYTFNEAKLKDLNDFQKFQFYPTGIE